MSKFGIGNQRVIDLIKKLLDERIVDSRAELAKLIGVPPQFIGGILKDKDRASKKVIDFLKENYSGYFISEASEPEAIYQARVIQDMMYIPLVHERAHAGYSTMWGDKEWLEELPAVAVDRMTDGIYVAFKVIGDSMEGEERHIYAGDTVIGREVYQHHWKNKLHMPNVFVIVLRNDGIMIKEVIGHDVDTGVMRCHAWNKFHDDEDVNLQDVVKLYHVKKKISDRIG